MIVQKPQSQGITIDLTGPQGNAFFLLGTAKKLARQLDFNESFILNEMKNGDYENLVKVFDHYFGSVVTLYRQDMTHVEKTQWLQMANQLQHKGLNSEEWGVMVELRKKMLISKGKNPSHYDLGSTRCSKKFGY